MTSLDRIAVDKPLWDLNTFAGRWMHFAWVTDPRTCITSDEDLMNAKKLVEQYRVGKEPPGTTRDQIIYAKKLYESAFHPDSGDLQNTFGRMSFQVPGGMIITGAMLQFYQTRSAVIFWQWINQSFNALVNYTNRNANSPVTSTLLGTAYVTATGAAMFTAFGCRSFLGKRANKLLFRYVPFIAVASANCVNIPLMRQNELLYGVDMLDEKGNDTGVKSKVAAAKGISQVVFSRIAMAAPGMTILPIVMEKLETYPWMQKIKPLHAPIQVMFVGCFLMFMVPTACALFPQNCALGVSTLKLMEPKEYEKLHKKYGEKIPDYLYFNKGL